jgi:hypothetical protein
MNVMILVLVAHFVSGTYNYTAEDVDNIGQCHSRAAELALARIEKNKTEDDKVTLFDFQCVEFPKPDTVPDAPAPKHVPSGREV